MPLQSIPHVQDSPPIEGESISEVIEHPSSEGVQNTSNLDKVCFYQQPPNTPSRMPS